MGMSMTDGRGNVTTYVYDSMDRLVHGYEYEYEVTLLAFMFMLAGSFLFWRTTARLFSIVKQNEERLSEGAKGADETLFSRGVFDYEARDQSATKYKALFDMAKISSGYYDID